MIYGADRSKEYNTVHRLQRFMRSTLKITDTESTVSLVNYNSHCSIGLSSFPENVIDDAEHSFCSLESAAYGARG